MRKGISRDGCVSTRALGSYSVWILGVVRSFLRLVKALSCVGVQSQAFFALNSSRNGLDNSAMFGENLPSWFIIPRNLQSSMTCPRNVRLVLLNSHFLLLIVMPAEERHFSTAWSRLLCLVWLCQKRECHP